MVSSLCSNLAAEYGPWPSAAALPLVYSPMYNIGFLGLERLHPFDSKKYAKVFESRGERVGFGGPPFRIHYILFVQKILNGRLEWEPTCHVRTHPHLRERCSRGLQVVSMLQREGMLTPAQLVPAHEASLEALAAVHDPSYLQRLHGSSLKVAQVTERGRGQGRSGVGVGVGVGVRVGVGVGVGVRVGVGVGVGVGDGVGVGVGVGRVHVRQLYSYIIH